MSDTGAKVNSEYRNEKFFDRASHSTLELEVPALLKLQSQSPGLKIFTPSSHDFATLNQYFLLDLAPHPLAICRPTNDEQVAHIVQFAVSENIYFTVRAGGHDSWGRSAVDGAIIIDMREIDEIVLAQDRKSARIGGGTIGGNLTKFLAPHGLVAVQGGCSSVGYTNWAACGGYSSLNGSFGLGCDQILGARIVNSEGEIIDADEEVLWGLRGGGCNFGVVVAMDIQVHELPTMLAGLVIFPIAEAKQILLVYGELLKTDFPDAYGGLMGFLAIPTLGTVLMMMFTWSSIDLDAGRRFLEKVRSLGTVVMDTVSETTLAKWTEVGKALSPTAIYTNIRTAYVKSLSGPFIDLLVENIGRIPSGTKAMFIVHIIHGQAAKPESSSCFGMREPHVWVGIHGQSMEEGNKREAYSWADEVVLDLSRSNLMMKGGYLALMGRCDFVEDCFGGNWERLTQLKMKADKRKAFQHAIPSIP